MDDLEKETNLTRHRLAKESAMHTDLNVGGIRRTNG